MEEYKQKEIEYNRWEKSYKEFQEYLDNKSNEKKQLEQRLKELKELYNILTIPKIPIRDDIKMEKALTPFSSLLHKWYDIDLDDYELLFPKQDETIETSIINLDHVMICIVTTENKIIGIYLESEFTSEEEMNVSLFNLTTTSSFPSNSTFKAKVISQGNSLTIQNELEIKGKELKLFTRRNGINDTNTIEAISILRFS
ncbi:hypothetical protein EHI_009850 [Entamoeba histolytica HM-1:IMSS]|uniref:Uncharacterized protein n=4 Tax=Entamoeba histolytica TaxID=5759 RepID=C4M0Q0_ENTH1|nr:hypothetical protein EHI_009850 [Entamoeba histolytica HM-1:IMSS]EAL51716.2 hypothetical protein EHI_009850 [Entamoeba histolytica HM-1:IMSS]EMD43301.1 Hypothetical protein EHI5A_182760 [Entamoeba histolytica KU27]|eukprot:XP_657106.2 hypothetical protein EHI_009850 [Entamoeba histolytica HM-1:IMSS]